MSTLKKEVAFIDANVADLDQLIAGLRSEVEPMVLVAGQSAPQQMVHALEGLTDLTAVHIVAHGRPGEVQFSGGALSLETLEQHADELFALGLALADDGVVQLYSCNVAEGQPGRHFVKQLADRIGAHVFASAGKVGAESLGGHWNLISSQAHPGVNVRMPIMPETATEYRHTLAITVGLAPASDTGSSNSDGITKNTTATITGTGGTYGNVVVVNVGGTDYNAAVGPTGAYSVVVSLAAGSNSISAQEYNGVNPVGSPATTSVILDTTVPYAPGAPDVQPISDTGTSSTDDLSNDDTPTARVSLSGTTAVAGDLVTLKSAGVAVGSVTLTATDISNGYADVTASTALGADGTKTLTATVTDIAGNESGLSTSLTYQLDKTAPTTTITGIDISSDSGSSASDFVTNVASQTVTATLSANLGSGEILYGSVDGGSTWTDITSKASGTAVSWDGVTLAGTSSIQLKVTDAAGNDGTVASQTYILDTTAPSIAIAATLEGDNIVNAAEDDTVTVSGTTSGVENGQTVSVALSDGFTTVTTTATVSAGAWTAADADISALTNGPITVTADVSDAAGNPATQASASLTLDNAAPSIAIAATLEGDNIVNAAEDDTVTVSGTTSGVENGQTVSVALSDGVTTVTTTATVSAGAWTAADADISALTNGPITVTADVSDVAGNPATQASASLTLDNAAPSIAIAATLEGDNIVNAAEDDTVTVSGTTSGVENGQTVSVALSDGVTTVTTTATVSAGAWTAADADISALTNGPITVTADVSDDAGNPATPASASLTLDNAAPSIAIAATLEGDNIVNAAEDGTVTVSGTTSGVENGQTVSVALSDGVTTVTTTATVSAGAWTAADADISALTNGPITVTADVSDVAGNPATQASASLTLDNAAPSIAIAATLEGDNIVNAAEDDTVTVSGTTSGVENGQTVSVALSDGVTTVTTTATVSAGAWTAADADISALTNGPITVTADVSDVAGNPATQASASLTLDNAAPSIAIAATLEGDNIVNAAEDGTVTVSGTTSGVENGQTVSVALSDGVTTVTTTATVSAGAWTAADADISALTNGPITVTADVSDVAGNPATQASASLTLDNAAPSIAIAATLEGDNIVNAAEDDTVTVSGTTSGVENGQTVSVALSDGVTTVTTTATVSAGAWTAADADISALTNGPITVTADVSDDAGNPATPASASLTLDNAAPSIAIAATLEGDNIVNAAEDDTVTVSGTTSGVENGQTVSVALSDGVTTVTTTATVSAGAWTAADADISALTNGPITVTADVSDDAGNPATPASASLTLDNVVDALPSTTLVIGGGTGPNVANATVSFVISDLDGDATGDVTFTDGTNSLAPVTVSGNGTYTADLSTLTGTITSVLNITDAAGNTASATGNTIYTTIQAAVTAATAGDTILVSEGTYTGNVVLNKSLTLQGASGDATDVVIEGTFRTDNGISSGTTVGDWLETAVSYTGAAGAGVTVSADDVTIRDLTITSFNTGIELGSNDGLTIDGVNIEESVTGVRKGTAAVVTNFEMTDGTISDSYHGMAIYAATAAGAFDEVTIDGVTFERLTEKGIYAEQLSNAVITNITMNDVGEFGRGPAFGAAGKGEYGNGIDINLKYGTYANIAISDFTFTDVGSSSEPDTVPLDFGGAISIKARDDGPSYNTVPASASNVTIANGTIDGTSTGIRVGEPGKNIAGPAVTVTHVTISDADVALYENVTQSVLTVNNADSSVTLVGSSLPESLTGTALADTLVGNGGNDTLTGGVGNDSIDGGAGIDTVVYSGVVADYSKVFGSLTVTDNNVGDGDDGTDTLSNVEVLDFTDANVLIVGNGSAYTTIQAAIDAASAGDTILIANGTYSLGSATLNVNKSLTIIGQSETGVIIDGSGIDGYGILVTADDTSLSNFTLRGPAAGGAGGNYGLKAQPDSGVASDRLLNLTIEHVTVKGSLRSEFDLNGVDGATLSDVTADGQDTAGVGIALTDSANVTLHNVATTGNQWGSVALYPSNTYYDQQVDDIVFSGTYTHTESIGIFVDDASATQDLGDVTFPPAFTSDGDGVWSVTNDAFRGVDSDHFTYFFANKTDAVNFALAIQDDGAGPIIENTRSVVHAPDGTLVVEAGFSIQAAVDAASNDDTITVGSGTYTEQVVIDGKDGLTLREDTGADVTIAAPTTLVSTGNSPTGSLRAINGIVTVKSASDVTIQGVTVDGLHLGGSVTGTPSPTMAGITYIDASGTIDGVEVTGIREPDAQFGNQRGLGIYITNSDPSPGGATTPGTGDTLKSIEIRNSIIEDFQKGGIAVSYADVYIHDNTVTGKGGTNLTAQNGIQVSGSTGSIEDNTVTAIGYTGANWSAAGILTYYNNELLIDGNTVTGSGSSDLVLGIATLNSVGGEVTNNDISQVAWGIDAEDYGVYGWADAMIPGASSYDYSSNTLTNIGENGLWFQPDAASTDAFNVTGTDGDDVIYGASAGDTLAGGDGNDQIDGGADADSMSGGTGDDTYAVDDAGDIIVEAAAGGSDTVNAAVDYTLGSGVEVENLTSAATGIDLTGNDVAQTIIGDAGDNTLTGNGGNDAIDGGLGTDTAQYAGSRSDYTVGTTMSGGFVTGFTSVTDDVPSGGDEGTDTLSSVEVLSFADGDLELADPIQLFDASGDLIGTFDAIDAAVAAAVGGQKILIADGTYTLSSTLNVDKSLTIIGESETGVVINAGSSGYGILVTADDSSLSNFTLVGTASNTYGLKASPDGVGGPGSRLNDLNIENVTVRGFGGSEVDLNGVLNATLSEVTADGDGTAGVGIAISDSANITLTDVTTTDNLWGSVGLYSTNVYYDQQTYNIVFSGSYTHDESVGIYADDASATTDLGNVTFPSGFPNSGASAWKVTNDAFRGGLGDSENFTFFFATEGEALAFALAIQQAANVGADNTRSVVEDPDGKLVVETGLTIQAAVDAADGGDTILVGAGTFSEDVTLTDGLAVTIKGGGDTTTVVAGQITSSGDLNGMLKLQDLGIDATGNQYGVFASNSSTGYAGSIVLNNVAIDNATQDGFAYIRAGNGGIPSLTDTVGDIQILNSDFDNNGTATSGSGGRGDVLLFGYNQDLTIDGSSFHGNYASGSIGTQKAIQLRGLQDGGDTVNAGPYDAAGAVSLNDLTITGNYAQDAIAIYRIASFSSFALTDVSASVSAPWGVFNADEVGGTLDLSGLTGTNTGGAGLLATPQGLATANTFTGTTGADKFTGRGGNDALDGGDGNDTTVLTGNRTDYTITLSGSTYTVVDNRGGAPDGTDSVTNVENFQFADGTLTAGGTLDIVGPTVTSVAYGMHDGTLKEGQSVDLVVTFSEAVILAGGSPTLTLNTGGTATYASSSASSLTFSYTVAASENTADLTVTAFNLNGATIKDVQGNDANPSGAVADPFGTLVVDTVAPTAVTTAVADMATDSGTSGDFITNDPLVAVSGSFSGTLGSGETIQVSADGTNWVTTGTLGPVDSIWASAADAVALVPGAGILQTRTMDAAGNITLGATQAYTLDTGADPLSISLVVDTGASAIDWETSNGMVAVSGLEGGASWQFSTDAGSNWTPGSGSSFTLGEGPYDAGDIVVEQTDLAGNTSSVASATAIVVDSAPPVAPVFGLDNDTGSNPADGITNDGDMTVTGMEAGGWKLEYSTNGGGAWTEMIGSTFTLSAGTYATGSIQVRQTDVAGNVGAPASNPAEITVDLVAVDPSFALVADTGSSSSDGVTSNGQIQVSGLEAGGSWQYSTNNGSSWTAGSGSSFTLAEGSYAASVIKVRQTDLAGNLSNTVSGAAITVDSVAPAAQTTSISQIVNDTGTLGDFITSDGIVDVSGQYTGTLLAGETLQVSANGGSTWLDATTSSPYWGASGLALIPGSGTLTTRTIDTAGNVTPGASHSYVYSTLPLFTGTPNADTLTGTNADEQFLGLGNNDTIYALGGNDIIDGGSGADAMEGGAGNDTYYYSGTGDLITENSDEGIDLVIAAATYTLGANVENLTLGGFLPKDGYGNNLNNVLTGNSAKNILFGYNGNDTLYGLDGNDTLDGGKNNDSLFGGSGDDSLAGQSGSDYLEGGAGNDTLNGHSEADTMVGGDGDDTYYYGGTGDVIVENSDEGIDLVIAKATYTLGANQENLTLIGTSAINGYGNSPHNNVLTGNSAGNILYGYNGNDTLYGLDGNDTLDGGKDNDSLFGGNGNDTLAGQDGADYLEGGQGNDTLNGHAGADTMVGGDGNDTYYYSGTGDVITEDSDEGIDLVIAAATYTLGANLENLTLSGTGSNQAHGNSLDNILTGNNGSNQLFGYGGNDALYGGLGNDTLTGGDDADQFVFNTALGPTNKDTIADFVHGTDLVVLENAVFAAFAATGTPNATSFDSGSGRTAADDALDRLVYNTDNGNLYYDSDGVGGAAAVQIATLTGLPTLSHDDFLIV